MGGCIALMNNLICWIEFETKLIEWKIQKGIYNEDPDQLLLDPKWWILFKRHNPEIKSKAGRKYSQNPAAHCHIDAFSKMHNQMENGLVKCGNAFRLENPHHMNKK